MIGREKRGMFDLKSPCNNCPFRIGYGELFELRADRITEIVNGVAFQCHKTVNYAVLEYDDEPDDLPETVHALSGDHPQQCAGLMTVLYRERKPNQIMQVAQRLGWLDPTALDPRGDAYATMADVYAAHGGSK